MPSPFDPNPYPDDAPEHAQWSQWNRSFFDQPTYAQLFELESQLRAALDQLSQTSALFAQSELQKRLRADLLELEVAINQLEEVADHAYSQVVTEPERSLDADVR
jgi:hypothetical protein